MTNPNLGQPVKNRYKVQVKQWAKWTNHGRRVFNDMYHAMRHSMQGTMSHPKALPLPRDHWQTLRWKFAWTAASSASKAGGATREMRIRQPKKAKRRVKR